MTEEVKANLSFDNFRRGQRIQVDINDARVAALIGAGYLTVVRKEHGDAGVDFAGVGSVSGVGVDSGVEGSTASPEKRRGRPRKEKVTDGPGESGQGAGVVDGSTVGDSAGSDGD